MKTNYHMHDDIYRTRKSEGHSGWADPAQVEEYHLILEDALKHEQFPGSGRILEIGCGSGENSIWLAKRGYDVSGIDISPVAIDWAVEKCAAQSVQINFCVGDLLHLPDYYDAGFFDAVIDGHCLHCIIGQDRPIVLSGILHALKPGGILHICSMCGDPTDEDMLKNFDPESRCLMRKGIAFRYIGEPQSILDEIRESGFEIISWKIKPRKDSHEVDDLLILARKP
jgi:SAM-dependent methyltransferase